MSSGDISHIRAHTSADELVTSLADLFREAEVAAMEKHGMFCFAVSGGSMTSLLTSALERLYDGGWDAMAKWHMFYVDERFVALDADESTHHAYRYLRHKAWWTVPDSNVHVIKSGAASVEEAALDYAAQLEDVFGKDKLPELDLILLGFGDDGHTTSLFPGHAALDITDAWVAGVTDSPKPPAERVTFTIPVINNAAKVAFVAQGEGKATAFAHVHHMMTPQDPTSPGSRVRPKGAHAVWLVDRGIMQHMEDGPGPL
jgi:6-phosphogluconolactonase